METKHGSTFLPLDENQAYCGQNVKSSADDSIFYSSGGTRLALDILGAMLIFVAGVKCVLILFLN